MKKKMFKFKFIQFHPFHLVTLSPWPLLMSMSILIFFSGVLNWFHNLSFYLMFYGIIMMTMVMFQWWRDVIREATFQGWHTMKVVKGLKLGMLLFIVSELFFFISIFWCYFHMFLSPSIEIGSIWPPLDIYPFNPYKVPLLNTIILLSSGASITLCHYSLMLNDFFDSIDSLTITIILGIMFSYFQYLEYYEASFTISDSVYGSIFFMSTGFHGLHVIIGTMFLMINWIRLFNLEYSKIHHFGFEAAAWYWHFVDVIWLFLYLLIYYWSS